MCHNSRRNVFFCQKWKILKYLLLQVSHLPTTLQSLLRSLPRQAAIIAASAVTIVVKKNMSQHYFIFVFHFALAMMIVSLTATAMTMTTVTTTAMIYPCLFYDSDKKKMGITYIFLFSSWWKWWENLLTMMKMEGVRGRGCCCFCNGDDNSYADDDCNRNNGDNSWLLFTSWKQWDDIGNFIFSFYIQWECEEEFVENEGNGRREGKSGLIFLLCLWWRWWRWQWQQ